ncbi:unnamed protein product [Echinostoma caproni]|uniref:Endo/exonuclease/phosphatase domain-containing protein n=1 Tax=Echinostoma caproni TaxID=27848 RepID=A0A183B5F7_9TREM|nr:unnamed protein product [Echinostoma caproni]
MVRTANRDYELTLIKYAKDHPKKYYHYVQSKVALNDGVGPIEWYSAATDENSKVDTLNLYFSSVHRTYNGVPIIRDPETPPAVIDDFHLTDNMVRIHLWSFNMNESAGPDGIHSAIVEPLASILPRPLSQLFKLSLEQSILPRDWKSAAVVAIHKGRPRSELSNYRPVSLTSTLCKVLKRNHQGPYL